MVPRLMPGVRGAALAAVLALAAAACSSGLPTEVAGPRLGYPETRDIPILSQPELGGTGGATVLGDEQLTEVVEAAPEGLRVTRIQIAPLSRVAREALGLGTFRDSPGGNGLISLPIGGVDPQLGMYYLIVPVVNEGPAPVRNLKARAEFYDARGVRVWTEEEPVTHFPTRLGLNPPSLPNDPRPPAGELGSDTSGFGLYYFAGNVGLFTFAVPDTAVAKTIRSWKLVFLVSTT